jgi:hypothetical protein
MGRVTGASGYRPAGVRANRALAATLLSLAYISPRNSIVLRQGRRSCFCLPGWPGRARASRCASRMAPFGHLMSYNRRVRELDQRDGGCGNGNNDKTKPIRRYGMVERQRQRSCERQRRRSCERQRRRSCERQRQRSCERQRQQNWNRQQASVILPDKRTCALLPCQRSWNGQEASVMACG